MFHNQTKYGNKIFYNIFNSLVIICMFAPPYLQQMPSAIHVTLQIGKILTFLYVVAIAGHKKIKPNLSFFWPVCLFGTSLISTIVNDSSIYEWTVEFINVLFVLIFLLIMQEDMKNLFYFLSLILGSWVHINLITYLLFPDGLYKNEFGNSCYFLGLPNTSSIYILLACVISIVCIQQIKKWYLWNLSVFISCTIFSLSNSSSSLVVAYGTFILSCFASYALEKTGIKRSAILLVFTSLLVFVAIQFFSIQNHVAWLLESLGKNTTLTSRTIIWEHAWEDIIEHPLMGYGMNGSEFYIYHFGRSDFTGLHSTYLQVIYTSGLVGFGIMLTGLIISAISFGKRMKQFGWIESAGLFAFLMNLQVEYSIHGMMAIVMFSFFMYNPEAIQKAFKKRQTLKVVKFIWRRAEK